jgi:signal transduction histidine kinase
VNRAGVDVHRTRKTGAVNVAARIARTAELHDREDALVRSLLTGVAVFRWLAWAWMAVLLAVNRSDLEREGARPWLALVLVGAALVVTAATTALLTTTPGRLLQLPVVAAEVAVACALEIGDELVYNGVSHPQSLSSAWPLAGVLTAGIAFRARGGMLAGAAIGLCRGVGIVLGPNAWIDRDTVSVVSSIVLYALAGAVAGFVTGRLRTAERFVSLAHAREEVARTLHDGVLQTLAVVQRRADDPDIVRLARDQERELREFLFGLPASVGGGGDLGARLRAAAARFEDRYGGSATVVLAEDTPSVDPTVAEALAGAVGEALTNAGKHGGAGRVTVFAEPDGDGLLFCSVKDDGPGFDNEDTPEGAGLRRSVRGRIAEIGGRVEVDGRPGRGTEVRCWVPVRPSPTR